MVSKILQTVLRTFQHYKLISANQTLIVAVSGGTDSIALLHILLQIREELGIRLHVAHLDHGIRGESAEADSQFVKMLAIQWALPYTLDQVDTPQLAKTNHRGIEETARHARYDFLARVAQEQHTSLVAVAHHADDQAETILMHIIRGSGLNGLRGMQKSARMPGHADVTLLRPLLNIYKSELEAYCQDNELRTRYDETNDDTAYQRNFLRKEIIPLLETMNPQVVDALGRLSYSASIDDAYIAKQLEYTVFPKVTMLPQQWVIALDVFHSLPRALQYRYIQSAYQTLASSSVALNLNQITDVVAWLPSTSVGAQVDLGQAIRIRSGYEDLYIEHQSVKHNFDDYILIPKLTDIVIASEPMTQLKNLPLQLSLVKPDSTKQPNSTVLTLPDDAVIRLRARLAGDRFRPKGMNGQSKTLKRWMIDRKIPQPIRNQVPLITINGEIVAILVGQTWHLADMPQYNLNGKNEKYLILG